ncbi:MAG: DUF2312 domain-containing protein, partial [Alphaproteobacteria bacterium]|nr:DUF2312 domain-containing protein [Alphaproteobacteria bacterium]
AVEKLRSFIERVERLEDQKAAVLEDIGEVYKEAKFHGFDTSIMRKVVKMRSMDSGKLQEQEQLLDLYKEALGL